jgi:hypothetical protein
VSAGAVVADICDLGKWCDVHKAGPFSWRRRSGTQKEDRGDRQA